MMVEKLLTSTDTRKVVINKINHLQQALEELQKSLPPFGPRKFAEAVGVILTNIRNFFYSAIQSIEESGIDTEEIAQEIITQSKICLAFLREVHLELLCFLEEIDSFFIPSELLFSIDNLLEEQFGKQFSLSFFPTWEFTYELKGFQNLVETYSPSIPTEALNFPKWFLFVSYPRMECRNALLHTMLIHEATHFIDNENRITASLVSRLSLHEESFRELISEVSQASVLEGVKVADLFPPERIYQEIHERCSEIMTNWTKELVCDSLAVRIGGPAYFFAMTELSVLANVMEVYTESHPASALRLKYLLEELKHMKYFERVPKIKELLALGHEFILHPRQLVLAGSFEFICLPSDLCAYVLSRSKYGRTGLMVATAAFVHPLWRGCLTLELFNYGDAPIRLECGYPIAQLVIQGAEKIEKSPKKQFIPTGPEFPIMDKEPDWSMLVPFRQIWEQPTTPFAVEL